MRDAVRRTTHELWKAFMILRRAASLLVCLAVTATTASPQATRTPEDVTGAYLNAVKAQRWDDMAALMHPEALDEFRAMLLPIVTHTNGTALREQFFAGASVAELSALSPAEFFARFMQALTTQSPELKSLLGGAKTDLLGHVSEGADTVHVVYRMNMSVQGIELSKMDVMSLRRTANGWRGLLSGNLRGFAAAMSRRVGA
jgi:hypothetical protein